MNALLASLLVITRLALPGQAPVNAMHPSFQVLDQAGTPVVTSGAAPSVNKTCGACHDAAYIDAHNSHVRDGRQATCVQCHLEDSRLPVEPGAYDDKAS